MEVRFSDAAYGDLDRIENYLLFKWNEKVWDDFNFKLDNVINLIIEGSVIFQRYENTEFNKVIITKHNSLIYKVDRNFLNIIRILQNFQDPEENFKSIMEE